MAYLTEHPPTVKQWYAARNRDLTGCTVLHTAESLMDTLGPDTGAEGVAEFIRGRTTPGSYHDLVDSDSWVQLVDYDRGAFHDGTGSNNWALSLSFACRTSDWRSMTPQRRAGFLAQGARAFAAQQKWRAAHGYPLTELRLISRAQSDAGMSGFTYHGLRDPGRRSDPGVHAPNLFPFDEFLDHCRAALAGHTTAPAPEDDMAQADIDEMQRKLSLLLGVETSRRDDREQTPGEQVLNAGLTLPDKTQAQVRQVLADGRYDIAATRAFLGPMLGQILAATPETADADAIADAIRALGDDLAADVASKLRVVAG